MLISLKTILTILFSIFRSQAALKLENLALRHQIAVLRRSARKRPNLRRRHAPGCNRCPKASEAAAHDYDSVTHSQRHPETVTVTLRSYSRPVTEKGGLRSHTKNAIELRDGALARIDGNQAHAAEHYLNRGAVVVPAI